MIIVYDVMVLVEVIRDKNRLNCAELSTSARFGTELVFIIMIKIRGGATLGSARFSHGSHFSKWPPKLKNLNFYITNDINDLSYQV